MLAPDRAWHPADQRLCARHVDGHAAGRLIWRGATAAAPRFQTGTLFGVLAGPDLLRRGAARLVSGCCCVGTFAAASMRPRTSPIASRPPTPRATRSGRRRSPGCWPAASSPASSARSWSSSPRICWPPYLFAATYLAQSVLCGARRPSCCMFAQIPPPPRRAACARAAARCGDRAPAALHRRGRVRGCELRDDEPGDDLGAARHGRLRPFGRPTPRSACNGMCSACSCRASSPAR